MEGIDPRYEGLIKRLVGDGWEEPFVRACFSDSHTVFIPKLTVIGPKKKISSKGWYTWVNTAESAQACRDFMAKYASLIVLSFLDGEAGKLDTAMSRSLDALSCIQDQSHPELLIDAWYTLGRAYYYSGNYPASLEFGLKAHKLARECGPFEKEGWCLDLVASTYKDPEQALKIYEEAYEIFDRLECIERQSRILNNWSYTLMELNEYVPALEKARKSQQA